MTDDKQFETEMLLTSKQAILVFNKKLGQNTTLLFWYWLSMEYYQWWYYDKLLYKSTISVFWDPSIRWGKYTDVKIKE